MYAKMWAILKLVDENTSAITLSCDGVLLADPPVATSYGVD